MFFDEQDCRDFDRISRLEWLETNGLGGFASSTVVGANTRRYHGLLTASLRPPVERYLLLAKVEETVVIGAERFDLSSNFYPGAVHPQGWRYLKSFRASPYPVWVYSVAGVEIVKRVFMPHGENTVVVEWELRGAAAECALEVRPLIAFRDYHSTTHANGALNASLNVAPGVISVQPYTGLPPLHFGHNAHSHQTGTGWYYNFEYAVERERGLDDREDLFCPLVLEYTLRTDEPATLIASLTQRGAEEAPILRTREEERRREIAARAPVEDEFATALTVAADQYIVNRGNLKTVVAGYHWFSDWGRDTMIALPGLTLITGQTEIARDILLAFSRHVNQGMLPNRFPDDGEQPEYNTVDATLWFFEAIRAYAEYTGDRDFIRDQLYAVMKDIIQWHLVGTRYGIRVDEDGLLLAGVPGVQLTWMDAKIGDWVVTPRYGKPVEIQALWYNALRVLAGFAAEFHDRDTKLVLTGLADRARESFNAKFWCEETSCFYDVVNSEAKDASVRPNQVIALSVRNIMPPPDRARAALAVMERELLTPKGLRTLSPCDAGYNGHYAGAPHQRDAIYHQGTVWPWLLGHFVTAYVRAHGGSASARAKAHEFLEPMQDELRNGCIGQLAEIFDGDAPHAARGCCAQAWSIAEILRALVEDVHQVSPRSTRAMASTAL